MYERITSIIVGTPTRKRSSESTSAREAKSMRMEDDSRDQYPFAPHESKQHVLNIPFLEKEPQGNHYSA